MNIGKVRIALALTAFAAICGNRLGAQDMVPLTKTMTVVPAVHYEPARPQPLRREPIVPASFQELTLPEPRPVESPVVEFKEAVPTERIYRFWARTEYLNWWITNAPVPVPLVTSATPPAIGALGEPGTTVLFGAGAGPAADFGAFSGARITIGGWLEKDYEYGWECTGFFLERRSLLFSASSPGGAAPGLAIPFNATQPFNLNPAGESSLNAGGAPSSATVAFTSQLWGIELNELAYVWATDNFYLTAVLGVRYLNMNENLTLTHTTFDLAQNGALSVTDGFGTHNQLFAGQIGTRAGGTLGRFTFDTAAMLIAGPMRQVVNVAGGINVTNGAFGFADGTTPVGLFAEPSNIGSHTRGVIAVGTELQFKVGYAITRWFQPYVAYNALYVNNVARPGNQIDRNVNVSQNAFFVPPGTLNGEAAPLTAVRGSDFWAHGFQFGMELRY